MTPLLRLIITAARSGVGPAARNGSNHDALRATVEMRLPRPVRLEYTRVHQLRRLL
ncbi:MAG: hypothetical protein DIU68_018250 [Chloroflexota bacterium]